MKSWILWAGLCSAVWGQSEPPQPYCSLPLGAQVGSESTRFRVYAPGADGVRVHVYTAPVGGVGRVHGMHKNPDGSWEIEVPGVRAGRYCTYSCYGKGRRSDLQVPDPYSKSVTAPDGRTLLVDDATPIHPRPRFPNEDAIIYEMHLRDFSIDPDSGIQRRGKYLGLTESGTRLHGHTTGLDYLCELGVNTLQIMPFTEFASDQRADRYGWGYDAALWMSPEGWYASQAWDSSPVRESRQMIGALHRRGVRVVMDLVLNHVDDSLRQRGFCLEALAPGYYFRRRTDGSYWNGSGCGNEFRSEAPMARRLIKDVVRHWVTEYQVDGFRFDLLGLMDQQTMDELVQELRAIDPQLLIYGEPWAADKTPIPVLSKGAQRGKGFAVFNDHFRDALKGSVFEARQGAFIQGAGQSARVRQGIAGAIDDFAGSPVETINYAECHDNHTLWDRLTNSVPQESLAEREKMQRMAGALLLTSQGIPFLHSGQEWLRSKGGDENSYDKPDSVNMLRWSDRVRNRSTVAYHQGLIALRRAHPMFRLNQAEQVRDALKFLDQGAEQWIYYELQDVTGRDSWKRLRVACNASTSARKLELPAGRWQCYVNGELAGLQPLSQLPTEVAGRTLIVVAESR